MTIPRLFVPAGLALGADIPLTAEQAHYLGTVMRRGAGDQVHVFNGRDGEWLAPITVIQRGRAVLTVVSCLRPQTPEPDIWLLFAPLKRDATDWAVQKATELGAAAIMPVITERTNAARVNEARLLAIAVEAAEQCERLTVPVIHPPRRLAEVLSSWPANRTLFAAIERAGPGDLAALKPGPAGAAALLVGPEGGFSPVEREALARHPNCRQLSLGTWILRAETACVAGLALLRARGAGPLPFQ
jgi:16S rRNA (uracil1498-N3)-methyltransferase